MKPFGTLTFVVLLAALAVVAGRGPASLRAAEVDRAVLQAESQRVRIMGEASKAAVAIFANGEGGGSGVVISPDGYVLSNFHVTSGAGAGMKCGMPDGKMYDGVIVGIDPVGDVALVKLLGRDDFPHATLGDSDQTQVGDWVFAVGNPFLLATDFQPTVTYGIVSGVHRYQYPAGTLLEYADCIQTDASINPGNSGGPLFNDRGELIGINGRGSFEKRGRVSVGVGYSISINQIKHFLGYLKSGRIVDHATLGAQVASDAEGRVIVSQILEDSDAFRRGLREGDEIIAFGGRQIGTVNAFKNVLGIFPKGWQVPLVYRRAGRAHEVTVRLAGVHSDPELVEKTFGRKLAEPKPNEDKPKVPKPKDENPGDAPPDGPLPEDGKKPGRDPHEKKEKPLPDIVKQHYQERHGYVNYYFNRLNQQRVWNAFIGRGSFSDVPGAWRLSGAIQGGGAAAFDLSDHAMGCKLPGGELAIEVGETLSQAMEPPGSGGLLAALHLWRRLLVLGPDKFGETFYLGAMPVANLGVFADVLVCRHAATETRFYFSEKDGSLVKQETYLRADDDPCELYFSDYVDEGGHWLPRQLEVRHGDDVYAVYRFDRVALGAQEAPKP